jgi:hypothetical protein
MTKINLNGVNQQNGVVSPSIFWLHRVGQVGLPCNSTEATISTSPPHPESCLFSNGFLDFEIFPCRSLISPSSQVDKRYVAVLRGWNSSCYIKTILEDIRKNMMTAKENVKLPQPPEGTNF